MEQFRYFGPLPAKIADIATLETADSTLWLIQEIPLDKLTPFSWVMEREVRKKDNLFIGKIMRLHWRDQPSAKELLEVE